MKKLFFVLPAALLLACPVLFAQTSASSDPLAPTQDVKSAEQIDREWQQSVSKYDANAIAWSPRPTRLEQRALQAGLGNAEQIPATAVVQGREVRDFYSLGCATRCRPLRTSGIRGTCTSRKTARQELPDALRNGDPGQGLQGSDPAVQGGAFQCRPNGQGSSRKQARGMWFLSRSTTTASPCTTPGFPTGQW